MTRQQKSLKILRNSLPVLCIVGIAFYCISLHGVAATTEASTVPSQIMMKAKIIRVGGLGNGRPLAVQEVDGKAATALAKLFPELGKGMRAEMAGSWIAGWSIIFEKEDGQRLPLSMDSEMRYWSEGRGDWNVAPAVPGIIRDILAKQNNPTTTEQ